MLEAVKLLWKLPLQIFARKLSGGSSLKYRYKDVLKYIDILIDGKFMKELKVEGKKFGSSNQRVINVQESLRKNKAILWNME